jgi:hypothetical protein
MVGKDKERGKKLRKTCLSLILCASHGTILLGLEENTSIELQNLIEGFTDKCTYDVYVVHLKVSN